MSFRLRIALLTAAAVAVAAIGASVAMYVVVQDQLLKQVDDTLSKTALVGGPGRGGPFGDPLFLALHQPQCLLGEQESLVREFRGDGGHLISK